MKRETAVALFLMAALTPTADARNPFEFGATEQEATDRERTPRLTLVLLRGESRIALIDGVAVEVGDEIPYGVVTRIDADTVRIRTNEGTTVTLLLGEERP